MQRSAAPRPRLQRGPPNRRDGAISARSWRDLRRRGYPCPAGNPIGVGAELQSQLLVIDAEIPVPAAGHGFRHQVLNFLRDDADIGLAAAEIAEAVVT